MLKPNPLVLLASVCLSACAATQPSPGLSPADKQVQWNCEQQALVAQEQYLARVKTPMYTSSFSSTWAGGARSDTGKWVFDAIMRSCMSHAQHAAAH